MKVAEGSLELGIRLRASDRLLDESPGSEFPSASVDFLSVPIRFRWIGNVSCPCVGYKMLFCKDSAQPQETNTPRGSRQESYEADDLSR